jgi:3-dehydroquinate dehydratase
LSKPVAPNIFVSIAGPTLASMEEQAGRVSSHPVGYEFRLDFLQDFTDLESSLRDLFARMHLPHVIATCRRAEAGGRFSGDVEQQVQFCSRRCVPDALTD